MNVRAHWIDYAWDLILCLVSVSDILSTNISF